MEKTWLNLHDKPGDEYYIQRKSKRYKTWKRKVLMRDNYTCRCCGKVCRRKNEIAVHHLDSFMYYPKGRIDLDNAVSLCNECHDKFHEEFGMSKNYRNQTVVFINIIRMRLGLKMTLSYKESVLPI